jgi:hypothetical protein
LDPNENFNRALTLVSLEEEAISVGKWNSALFNFNPGIPLTVNSGIGIPWNSSPVKTVNEEHRYYCNVKQLKKALISPKSKEAIIAS